METAILTVRELTEQLRETVEGKFPFVWVRGEIGSVSRPASGHIYFSLKDPDVQLQCVWFRNMQRQAHQKFNPLTGEVFDKPRPPLSEMLASGREILCAGRIGIYAPRGQYQLVVELVQPAGQGLLAQAFEERKRKLAALGYFDMERKRKIPSDPQRVAVVSSLHGAALQDFLTLARQRGSGACIRVFPALVQGAEAMGSITAAMAAANGQDWAQVIVLIRGGGSLEDLWTFNEESVARAIFHSRLPVLAGIGHEVDTTLADMTADARAATPSHAAQLLWPLRAELVQRVDEATSALQRAVKRQWSQSAHAVERYEDALHWLSPLQSCIRLSGQLDALEAALKKAVQRWLDKKFFLQMQLDQACRSAPGLAKIAVLESQLSLLEGKCDRAAASFLAMREQEYALSLQKFSVLASDMLLAPTQALERLTAALQGANPMALLQRGYALIRHEDGRLLRSVKDATPGKNLVIRLHDGSLDAVIAARHLQQLEEEQE